jgi:hypothetical protein
MMMSFVDFRVTFVLRILIGLFGKRTYVASNQIPFPVSRYQSMNLVRAYLRKELNVYRRWVREDDAWHVDEQSRVCVKWEHTYQILVFEVFRMTFKLS